MDTSVSRTSSTLLTLLKNPADGQAWGEFVDRYGPRVYRWCQARGLQQADCEDVTQQVLTKFVQTARRFEYDRSKSFRAWLKTLTRHAVADLFADFARFRGSGDSQVLERLQQAEADEDLERALNEEFERELLEGALYLVQLRVEPATWRAFQMTTFEGRPAAEAAAELNMSVAAVYMAKSRVQKMVKEEIQAMESQP